MTAKSGLYALTSLDGGPLDPRDVAVLGLNHHLVASHRLQRDGILALGVDREEEGRAVDIAERGDGFTILLGHLDERAALAGALGVASSTPPAALAAAALGKFGADAPVQLIGEWSLLDWHAPSRTLTLLMSEASRDPLYFAIRGNRVAASAEMNRLTRLDWVGRAFDPAGLLLHWSTARLRRYMSDETPFRHVRRLVPGSREVFRIGERRTLRLPPPPVLDPWSGSFAEGMEAIEATMRRITRQHLERHRRVASLLSGGLDSSLLAWLEAAERCPEQPLLFLSSVAPDDSGIPDEREFSKAVADHLGLPIRFITPPPDASFYIPDSRLFAHLELPVVSPRHYLYNALYEAASEANANVLFDGAYGELTITNPFPLKVSPLTLRYYVRAYRAWRAERVAQRASPSLPLHVRLSPDIVDAFATLIPHDWKSPYDPVPKMNGREQWGVRVAAAKNAMTPTSSPDARLRHVFPYRDRRLLRLVATMPASYMEREGLNRTPARLMLKNRLPDSVRLRRTGGAFSPDFLVRAERQATVTVERISDFRAIGAGAWIDLDWLEGELKQLAMPGVATHDRVQYAQSTAVAASYLEWLSRQ